MDGAIHPQPEPTVSYAGPAPVLVAGDSDAARRRASGTIEAAGLRIADQVPVGEAIARLDRQISASAIWLELDGDGGPAMDNLLDRLNGDARAGRYPAVVAAPMALVDALSARLTDPAISLLIDGKAGVSRSVWADMRRHGNPSRRTLAKLLAVAGSSLAEFEALRIGEDPRPEGAMAGLPGVSDSRAHGWRPAASTPVPLHLTMMGGAWGDDIRQIEMAEINTGEVAEELGRRVFVSPRAPVAIGDDVVVQLRPVDDQSGRGAVRILIKELLRRTAGHIELRQFNPDISFRVEADEIAAIHKVVGEVF